MKEALPVHETPISRPNDLEPGCVEETDGDSSTSSESDYIDRETEPTTVDDADNVERAFSPEPKLGCDSHDEDLHKLHLTATIYAGQENSALGTYVNGQNFNVGEVVDAPLGSTRVVTDKDSKLAIKLEQDAGSGRHYHQLGTSESSLGPGVEGAFDAPPNLDLIPNEVHTSWTNPEESTSEAVMAIQRVEELIMIPDSTTGSHPHVQMANTPFHGRSLVSGPATATMREEELTTHLSTVEDKQSPTEEDLVASAPAPNAALQIRVNVVHGKIHRLMSTTSTIDFNVDISSFSNAQIPPDLISHVIAAARIVAREFAALRLGIAFAYSPQSRSRAFRICCDPSLPAGILAQAFFPSQPRGPRGWQLRISPFALLPYHFQEDPQHMVRTLAHEFMHILGFRHYNAREAEDGTQLKSVLWPNTIDGNPNSIMHTPTHNRLWFSAEDVRVLRELYSRRNGDLVGGREIRDVDAHNGR